ncbi:DUF5305 domain-containing protein [Natronomonas sp. F2-12]|jgi:hypothetical protein|uniref:DUF5305 domain-containing protein n=1 Tax=Natronomonas aquatica TaxID=2841590 RepID=A0A9R1CTH5_9EURY|nr:DUF5305 family protein [Natronomonas aquatica]MCQ4333675.1 DUF5305 domain-containing protein [Natronomonas aquatica]
MSASTRVKHQVAVYGAVAGAVLVVLGIAAIAAGGYVYTNPPTEEIPPQETDVQEFSASIDHSAEVVETTPLYESGTTVENQPVYFTNATPDLRIVATANVPDDRPVNVSHELTLYREITFQETVFWDEQEMLAADRTVVEDGQLRIEAELDVRSVAARNAEIDGVLADVGSVTTGIRLRTTYETESTDGEPYEGELTTGSQIQITDRAYWFQSDFGASATESQTTAGSVREQPPNFTLVGALGGLGILLVLGGIGLAYWSSRTADVRDLEEQVYRARYDEWISEGDFPTDAGKQYVYINSLEDLVDIAIDTGKRVIHDPELEVYGVVDEDIVYYHASDPTTVDSWVNFSRGES